MSQDAFQVSFGIKLPSAGLLYRLILLSTILLWPWPACQPEWCHWWGLWASKVPMVCSISRSDMTMSLRWYDIEPYISEMTSSSQQCLCLWFRGTVLWNLPSLFVSDHRLYKRLKPPLFYFLTSPSALSANVCLPASSDLQRGVQGDNTWASQQLLGHEPSCYHSTSLLVGR